VTEAAQEGPLLGRAAQIARVFAKHGLAERRAGRDGEEASPRARARRLRDALEELGPTFAKLGQILSTRPDLLPPEVVEELETLQDRVTPLSEAEVVQVMEEELGVPWEDVFESIDPEPLAAGTIGQAHRARLENGDRVVVKVQRPRAREEIMRDLGLLELFAEKAANRDALRSLIDVPALVEHLSRSLRRELDFRHEAANIERMHEVLEPYPRLDVPRVYNELSSARLLVMEEIQGIPVRQAPPGEARVEAARQLLESYYRQVLGVGFFHADPHPGNMLWWQDRLYLLDLGMVGELGEDLRGLILMLVLAFWQEDAAFLADVMLLLAGKEPAADFDLDALRAEFAEYIGRFREGTLRELQLGPMIEGLAQIASKHGIRLPASLALTGKAFAQMQLATAELDPTLDPFAVVSRFLLRGMFERLREGADPKRLLYESRKVRLRLTRLLESVEQITGARPGRRLRVELGDVAQLEATLSRLGRRLALAAAFGAALIATVIAAASTVGTWVPSLLGAVAGVLGLALFGDLLRGRR
jgi:predicted unusual protein kinase regulating ubiquinone biosynthesis (AarF/ABC1/UbiB family)